METRIKEMESATGGMEKDEKVGCLSKLNEASAEVNDSAVEPITVVKFRKRKAAQLMARMWRLKRRQAALHEVMMYMAEDDPAIKRRITMNHQSVPIKKDQTKGEAVKEFLKDKGKSEKAAPKKDDGGDDDKKLDAWSSDDDRAKRDAAWDRYNDTTELGTPPNKARRHIFNITYKIKDKFDTVLKKDKPTLKFEFKDFDIPENSGLLTDHTAAQVVLGEDGVVIWRKDLPKYEKVLATTIKRNKILGDFQKEIDGVNKMVQDHIAMHRQAHRGMNITEISDIANNNGEVGHHKRDDYAAKMDFVSSSIYQESADRIALEKDTPITVHFDVSGLKPSSEYRPIRYELRRDMKVTDSGKDDDKYRPHEKYGGSHSCHFMPEAEIHLHTHTKPTIRGIRVLTKVTPDQRKTLKADVKTLEKIQGSSISIKYTNDGGKDMTDKTVAAKIVNVWDMTAEERRERAIKNTQSDYPWMDRDDAIMHLARWS